MNGSKFTQEKKKEKLLSNAEKAKENLLWNFLTNLKIKKKIFLITITKMCWSFVTSIVQKRSEICEKEIKIKKNYKAEKLKSCAIV